tara:strand:+ start:219 stop:356 length:138 start_codon:yes stop_codon:yes gene_type:complete
MLLMLRSRLGITIVLPSTVENEGERKRWMEDVVKRKEEKKDYISL